MCATIVKIAIKNIYLLWANESEKCVCQKKYVKQKLHIIVTLIKVVIMR